MLIHDYAKDGDLDGVKRELARGTDVDQRNPDSGHTPLMIAAASAEAGIELLQLLIEKGADVNASHSKTTVVAPKIDLDALQKIPSGRGGEVAAHFDPELMKQVQKILSNVGSSGIVLRDTVLKLAIHAGNLEKIKLLLDAGADIHYRHSGGYGALIDAMHGRPIARDPQLIPIVRLLIERGADMNTVTQYCESALSVSSYNGRFDAVRVLLDAGADPTPQKWNSLMKAVALGNVSDVRTELQNNPDLSARDFWERTAWLLSVHTGDVEKAKLILAAGANRSDRGRCKRTPMDYPIRADHVQMVKWLLLEGFDPNDADQFGSTPLMAAVEADAFECVQLLIEAGSDVHRVQNGEAIVKKAVSVCVLRKLLQSGGDINDISDEMRGKLTRVPLDGRLHVSREEYVRAKRPQFGKSNPEKMNFPFWKSMVTSGCSAYAARKNFNDEEIKDGPVWCFQRFGKSITELPDGRIVEIAGEHEDHYDPDFCIYNDVVVHNSDGSFDIFGYPKDVFPATDFHTATLVGRFIFIVGNLGHANERKCDETPVFRLDIDTFAIQKIQTFGDSPDWISRHKAVLVGQRKVRISRGKVNTKDGEVMKYIDNTSDFVLDIDTLEWTKSV